MNSVTQRFSRFRIQISSNAKSRQDPSMRLRLSRDDRLWHLKSHTLPKAVSQSLRIQLALNSLIRTPVPKAETGILSQNSASPNIAKSVAFCSFVPLQRKTQFLRQNLIAKVLWHIKIRFLPNAPSQSPRIQLTLNSLIRTPVSKARTGVQSQNSASPNSLAFVPLQRKTQFL